MKQYEILALDLRLFDGAAGAGASGGGSVGGAGGEGGDSGALGQASQDTAAVEDIQYGKQPTQTPDADPAKEKKGDAKADKAKREAAYREMMQGEYKDLFDADVNRIVGKRFKTTKGLQEQLDSHSPILDAMAVRYGTPAGDIAALQSAVQKDTSIYAEAAEAEGMSVPAYMEMQKMRKQLAQKEQAEKTALQKAQQDKHIKRLIAEAEALKPKYPNLNILDELKNDRFARQLHAGFSVEDAYKATHMDEILQAAASSAVQQTQKAVVANIQARGNRPKEAGISAQTGIITKSDPRNFTKEDRKEIRKRVARGETIKF